MKKLLIENVLPIVGAICIAHGAYQIHPGLGLIVLGLSAIGIALTLSDK